MRRLYGAAGRTPDRRADRARPVLPRDRFGRHLRRDGRPASWPPRARLDPPRRSGPGRPPRSCSERSSARAASPSRRPGPPPSCCRSRCCSSTTRAPLVRRRLLAWAGYARSAARAGLRDHVDRPPHAALRPADPPSRTTAALGAGPRRPRADRAARHGRRCGRPCSATSRSPASCSRSIGALVGRAPPSPPRPRSSASGRSPCSPRRCCCRWSHTRATSPPRSSRSRDSSRSAALAVWDALLGGRGAARARARRVRLARSAVLAPRARHALRRARARRPRARELPGPRRGAVRHAPRARRRRLERGRARDRARAAARIPCASTSACGYPVGARPAAQRRGFAARADALPRVLRTATRARRSRPARYVDHRRRASDAPPRPGSG